MLTATLILYCALVMAAALAGGLVPMVVRLSHRAMQVALSFVSGVMLGVAVLHMLPHAWLEVMEDAEHSGVPPSLDAIALWLLAGFLLMFLLERFLCFHHHEMEACSEHGHAHGGDHAHDHDHTLSWAGALIGLSVHSILNGVALAAAVIAESHGHAGLSLAGFGTFLVIFLHKPFDSLTIGTLMAAGKRSARSRLIVSGLYALAVPAGAVAFTIGGEALGGLSHSAIAAALALSAGMFLCIALSDVLPELQFHRHDRIKLTAALLAGLALAYIVGVFEGEMHGHGGPMEVELDHDHAHDHDHPDE
jgi:zinc and cadmium transporter